MRKPGRLEPFRAFSTVTYVEVVVVSANQPSARFDTVGIAVPVDDFDPVGCTHTIDGWMTPGESHRWSRKLAGGGFLATGMGNKAWIEASIPKRIDPDGENIHAVGLDEMLDGVRDLFDEASNFLHVSRGHVFDESKIVRMDLVRDFSGVDDMALLLDGLADVPQPGRSKVRRFADPARQQAETLRVGPKAWGCTLYDKAAETGGKAAPGSLRFEARLHQSQLSSKFARDNGGHFLVLEDVVDRGDALARASRAWFDRAGFSHAVAPRDVLADRVRVLAESDALSPTRTGVLWAVLTLPGFASDLSRNTRAKYRKIARDARLGPAFDELLMDDGVELAQVIELDYVAGTSIRRAA